MTTNTKECRSTNAVIHFKDGKRKHGLLLEEMPNTTDFLFVSRNSAIHFTETMDQNSIEIVPGMLIEAIEVDFK